MDDILEILNMPSWSDIGGLRNQLEYINPSGAAAAAGDQMAAMNSSSNPDCKDQAAATAAAEECQDHSQAYVESFLSPHLQSQDGLQLSSGGGGGGGGGGGAATANIGVNCNIMNQAGCSLSPFPMILPGEANSVMASLSTSPSGTFMSDSSRLWQQPFIGDIQQQQQQQQQEIFNLASSNGLFSTRYRSGHIPSNLRLHREGASNLFNAYGLGQQKPPIQSHSRGAYRNAQPAPMAPISGAPRPRVRARRGQATDPHSIAERQRRERIAERMKQLQGLVPNANKTDKAIMLDEIIEYVKFLQLQSKIFTMCRMGNSGSQCLIPSPESYSSAMATSLSQSVGASAESLASLERQAARLMDESMESALQFLQSKGFCLMPVSMAAALSTTKAIHQPFPASKPQPSTITTTESGRPQ